MATNGNTNHGQYAAPAQTSEAPANTDGSNANLPKDEVGWYFVEQYYTTMSKSPDRLHLFYGKKAQFVCGREAEVVNVSFGRQAIQERIKGMDFQDCKVRISNVDTQGSEENILITVIGEMANKDGEPKKFVQTFVLAQQPSGYFVLNDMLRYINEDLEDEEPEAIDESASRVEMPATAEAETKTEEAVQEQQAPLDPEVVDEKLGAVQEQEAPPAAEAETQAEPAAVKPAAEEKEAVAEEKEAQPDADKAVAEIAKEEVSKPEVPADPAPTPAVAAPAPAPAATPAAAAAPAPAPAPAQPPKPMSWASRAAAAAAAAAGAPTPKAPVPQPAAQPRAPVPAVAQRPAPVAQAQESAPAAPKEQGSEWQTAETKRQSRASPAAQPEKEGTMAYIKYVTEKVSDSDLEAVLKGFGELAYFDINRTKNCAFVEYKTPAGYKAAIAASPVTINGESVVIEQRRPKANAYGGANYSAGRGGGRRVDSGRGGFAGRGRGAPRGRGPSTAA